MTVIKMYANDDNRLEWFSICGWNLRRVSDDACSDWVLTDPDQQIRGQFGWLGDADTAVEDITFKFAGDRKYVRYGPQHCPKGTIVQFASLYGREFRDAQGQPINFEVDYVEQNGWRSWLVVTTTKDTSPIWSDADGDQFVSINVDHITRVVRRGTGGHVEVLNPYAFQFARNVKYMGRVVTALERQASICELAESWVTKAVDSMHTVDSDRVYRFIVRNLRINPDKRVWECTSKQLKNIKRAVLRNRNRLLTDTHFQAAKEEDQMNHDFERDLQWLDDHDHID